MTPSRAALFNLLLLIACIIGLVFLPGCNGVDPPPLDCRVLGCEVGNVCTEIEPGRWACRPAPPECSAEEPCDDGYSCVEGKCVKDPWECHLDMPGCHDTGQVCSDPPDARCWTNPSQDPEHCEEAVLCEEPPPLPQPQCDTFTDRGGNVRVHPAACDCYDGQVWTPCQPSEDCPFNTPTAAWMEANDYECTTKVQREGRKGISAGVVCTRWPDLADGTLYYCQDGLWPARCAEGRRDGPVAPPGHPKRAACENVFWQQQCARFTYSSSTHMSFDPWIVLNSENQNHPRNVRICGQGQFETHESWKKDDQGYIKEGQWGWATAHGDGFVCAEAKGGKAKGCISYVEQ